LNAIAREVPGAFVGMDVIAGFPGETNEEFADTFERLARLPCLVCMSSLTASVPVRSDRARNPVPRDLRALRAARLRDLSTERFASLAQRKLLRETALVLRAHGKGRDADARLLAVKLEDEER